jgi:hypothetical protein
MALPQDITKLMAPLVGPAPSDWVPEFSGYPWFRVVGFPGRLNCSRRGLRADFGVPGRSWPLTHKDGRNILLSSDTLAAATRRIPDAWKRHPDFVSLDWTTQLSVKQMRAAIDQQPLQLVRACLVVAAIDALLESQGHGKRAIEDHVRIAPAYFYLEGFTPEFFAENFESSRENLNALMRATTNSNPIFFRELTRKAGATYSTLEKTKDTIGGSMKLKFGGQVAHHTRRGHKHPSLAENPVFPGD